MRRVLRDAAAAGGSGAKGTRLVQIRGETSHTVKKTPSGSRRGFY